MIVQPRALFTEVVAVAVLLAVAGSGWAALTLAVFVIVPVALGSAVTVIVALAPGAREPRAQLAPVAVVVQVPCEGAAEMRVTPAPESVSDNVTPVAVAVEVAELETVTVYEARSLML